MSTIFPSAAPDGSLHTQATSTAVVLLIRLIGILATLSAETITICVVWLVSFSVDIVLSQLRRFLHRQVKDGQLPKSDPNLLAAGQLQSPLHTSRTINVANMCLSHPSQQPADDATRTIHSLLPSQVDTELNGTYDCKLPVCISRRTNLFNETSNSQATTKVKPVKTRDLVWTPIKSPATLSCPRAAIVPSRASHRMKKTHMSRQQHEFQIRRADLMTKCSTVGGRQGTDSVIWV